MSYKINKPKLSPQKLVEKMRDEKGISFKYEDEADAVFFLSERNNYLRTACYREFYPKYQSGVKKGKYIDLDFSYLKELSIIDMHYRFLVKKMCSDIEHSLCVMLLTLIDNDNSTDGYDIVDQFLSSHNNVISNIERSIASPHTGDLIKKYFTLTVTPIGPQSKQTRTQITAYNDCPAWVLVEILSFGDLLTFYDFYVRNRGLTLPANRSILNLVRNLRNGASHDSCLLCHLAAGTTIPEKEIVRAVNNMSTISVSQRQKKLSSRTILEFTALIYLYGIVVKGKVKEHRIAELHDLFYKRIPEKKGFFISNNTLTTSYAFCCEIIKNML